MTCAALDIMTSHNAFLKGIVDRKKTHHHSTPCCILRNVSLIFVSLTALCEPERESSGPVEGICRIMSRSGKIRGF